MSTANPTFSAPHSPFNPTSTCTCSNPHCIRRLILAVLLLFALLTFIIIIPWLLIHPQDPLFQVNSLSLSNFTLSNSRVAANYEIELTIRNPNPKIDLQFGRSKISLYYKSKNPLSRGRIDPFFLPKMNQTWLIINSGYSSYDQMEKKTDIHKGKEWSKREVIFTVRTGIWVKFMATDWPSKDKSMEVICDNLKVGFSSDNVTGTLMGGRRDCLVHECS